MNLPRLAFPIAFVSLFALPACEDGGFDTGVEKSKTLEELDDSDQDRICEAAMEELEEAFTADDAQLLGCAIAGTISAEFASDDPVGACQEAYDACLQEPLEEEENVGEEWTDCEIPQCEATVGQLEACFDESLAAFDEVIAAARDFRCDDVLTSGESPLEEAMVDEDGACAEYERLCPSEEDAAELGRLPTPHGALEAFTARR